MNLKKKKLVFKSFIRKRFYRRVDHHQYKINLKIQKQSANEFNFILTIRAIYVLLIKLDEDLKYRNLYIYYIYQ